MKNIDILSLLTAASFLTGCVNSPGDGHTVYTEDWEMAEFVPDGACWRCRNGSFEDCERCTIRYYYLPLTFTGYTDTPGETITLEQWVPNEAYVRNSFHWIDTIEGPIVSDYRDHIYLDSERAGRNIPGRWEAIKSVRSHDKELPGGWHFWSASVDFRPVASVAREWEATFVSKPERDNQWRFDFRVLGEEGNVLYCWEEGFPDYFFFEEDLVFQYAEHMAQDPGIMSIYFDRNE